MDAAIRAGNLITSYKDNNVICYDKSKDTSPAPVSQSDNIFPSQIVTEVDFKSQDIIVEALLPAIHDHDLGLLTEEGSDDGSRFEKDYFWAIDPLDGTLQFAEGKDGYSIAIALIDRQGQPQIGVVLDLVRNTLYHAIKGSGAYRNNVPVELPPLDHGRTFCHICDRSFTRQRIYEDLIEALEAMSEKLGYSNFRTYEFGGSVMNGIRVLEESPAVFFKFPQTRPGGGCIWDFAATACIYNEVGAYATDICGESLRLNGGGTSYLNHSGVIYTGTKAVQEQICSLYKEMRGRTDQIRAITG